MQKIQSTFLSFSDEREKSKTIFFNLTCFPPRTLRERIVPLKRASFYFFTLATYLKSETREPASDTVIAKFGN